MSRPLGGASTGPRWRPMTARPVGCTGTGTGGPTPVCRGGSTCGPGPPRRACTPASRSSPTWPTPPRPRSRPPSTTQTFRPTASATSASLADRPSPVRARAPDTGASAVTGLAFAPSPPARPDETAPCSGSDHGFDRAEPFDRAQLGSVAVGHDEAGLFDQGQRVAGLVVPGEP